MAELPERKVLKDMIVKLKAKVIESQQTFLNTSASINTVMTYGLDRSLEAQSKMQSSDGLVVMQGISSILQMYHQNFVLLNNNISALIKDMNLYIETLEKYSTELDNTLSGIFQMAEDKAKKDAEEQQKQQEELMKKQPSYRT